MDAVAAGVAGLALSRTAFAAAVRRRVRPVFRTIHFVAYWRVDIAFTANSTKPIANAAVNRSMRSPFTPCPNPSSTDRCDTTRPRHQSAQSRSSRNTLTPESQPICPMSKCYPNHLRQMLVLWQLTAKQRPAS